MDTSQDAQRREEELRRRAAEVERTIGAFSGRLAFSDEVGGVTARQTRLGELSASLERARSRGYLYSADLEPTLAAARAAAPQALADSRSESEAAARSLRPRVDDAVRDARALAREPRLSDLAHRVESLEREAQALETAAREAEQRITSLTRPFTEAFDGLERRLREAHRVLDAFDSRSFAMVPEESPVAAAPVTWLDPPDGQKMKGLLLLTDHRLRFEQREERVTKRKLLLFAAEKEKIQKCWVDEPVGHVQSSEDRTKGVLFKDQLLALQWAQAAHAPRTTTFELDGGAAKELDAVVESVVSGDLARQRWAGATAEVAAPRLEFPDRCEACGATLEAPVKGQTRLACAYCGRQHPGRPAETPAAPAAG
jgi:hypothetical protein